MSEDNIRDVSLYTILKTASGRGLGANTSRYSSRFQGGTGYSGSQVNQMHQRNFSQPSAVVRNAARAAGNYYRPYSQDELQARRQEAQRRMEAHNTSVGYKAPPVNTGRFAWVHNPQRRQDFLRNQQYKNIRSTVQGR
jgi:hypothetical protein